MHSEKNERFGGKDFQPAMKLRLSLSRTTLLPAVLAWLAISTPAGSAAALTPYQATYTASLNGLPVTVTSVLEATDKGYRVSTSATNVLGQLLEHEDFHLAGERIVVDEYRHQRALLGSRRIEHLVVDLGQGVARYQRDDKIREIPLTPGLLGPMSYQVQLRRDLAAGNSAFDYQVLHRGKVKQYHFQTQGTESVTLPKGAVEAIRIRRVRDDNDRETIVWIAPKFDYQLIKLRQIEDGDSYELLLSDLNQRDATGSRP